jgi:hypothetical protein
MSGNAGFANPAVAGYFSRGVDIATFLPAHPTVYKWSFPADVVTTTSPAPANIGLHAGFANPAVAGYFSKSDSTSDVYKWAFPVDTVSTTSPALDTMQDNTGFANS